MLKATFLEAELKAAAGRSMAYGLCRCEAWGPTQEHPFSGIWGKLTPQI